MNLEPKDLEPATRASDDAVQRVKRRLEGVPVGPPGGTSPWIAGAVVVGGAALALLGAAWLSLETPLPNGPIEGVLDHPKLHLEPEGTGLLEGTAAAPRVRWDGGRLVLEAEVPTVVRTRELELVGEGRFTVTRSMGGSRVEVEAGRVQVTCVEDPDGTLGDGQALGCRPVSADSALGRIQSVTLGLPERLAEIDRAEALAQGTPEARAELGVLRIATLLEAQQPEAALAASRSWLERGSPVRRDEVLRLASALALQTEGCSGAVPLLRALAPTDPEARAALETCTEGENR